MIENLDQAIRRVCPIEGVNSAGVIWFMPEATAEQRAAAQAIVDAYGPLDDGRYRKLDELSAACQAQIYAGFQSSALGAPYHYPAKDRDQANLAGSVLESVLPGITSDWTTPFWCCDANGNWSLVAHNAAQIQQVGRDAKAAKLAAIEKNAALAAQVNSAATIAAVESITW